jgi:hypothetical protein
MNSKTQAAIAGLIGALATNILHETARRALPNPPRVDLLGMQAVAKSLHLLKLPAPKGRALYGATLVGDIITNAVYFSLVGAAPRERATTVGSALGIVAGCGSVMLPPRLGLAAQLTNRTTLTRLVSIALYTAGGLAAGYTQQRLARTPRPSTHDAPAHSPRRVPPIHPAVTGSPSP